MKLLFESHKDQISNQGRAVLVDKDVCYECIALCINCAAFNKFTQKLLGIDV